MQFGNLDLSQLLGGTQGRPLAGSTPQIKANQSPLANSWGADGSFKLGFPPSSAPNPISRPVDPSTPAPAPAPQPQPAQPQTPMTPPSNFLTPAERYLEDNPGVRQYYENNDTAFGRVGNNWDRAARQHYDLFGRDEGRAWHEPTAPSPAPASMPPTFVAPPQPQPTAQPALTPQAGFNPFADPNRYVKNPFMMGLYK